MTQFKCASFFAGVGGIDLGFERTKKFKTVYANEFDSSPVETFKANFKSRGLIVDNRDIHDVLVSDIGNSKIDVVMGGFPCQAFSIAGERQGFNDQKGRGTLFFEMLRLIRDLKPQVVFFENVKNLETHDKGRTLKTILDALAKEGYHDPHYKVLNAMDYGNIPQNRERIYIVCFRDKEKNKKFKFPEKQALTTKITEIIDFKGKYSDKYYYTPGKYKIKGDIYQQLVDAMDDPMAVYQWRRVYVRKNKSGVVPTLTANQGEGGHNVCLVKTQSGIRKMTPRECFNAQGFPKSFRLPQLADSKLYKQAGNSVCVPVIQRIAENIARVLEENN